MQVRQSDFEQIGESVLARMPESVAVYSRDARVVYVNPATERIFGKALAEMRGQRLWDLFPDAVTTPFAATFAKVASEGGEQTLLHYYAPFARWFDNRFERVGEMVHVIARDVTDDVSRRRRLEALARISAVVTANERKPAALAAIAKVLMEELDAMCSLALLTADQAHLEIVAVAGHDADAVEAARTLRWPAHLGHPAQAIETRETILALRRDVTAQGTLAEGEALKHFIAHFAPSSVVVAPLVVGDAAIGVLMASRMGDAPPLTEHDRVLVAELSPTVGLYLGHARRLEEAADLRDKLAAVADSNPALVSFIDRDERYVYVNASYERWFGAPRASFLGKTVQEMVGAAGYATIAPAVREALSGRPVSFRANIAYRSGERIVDSHYQPIFAGDGTVEGFAVTALDVTAEKLLEDQERASYESQHQATRRLESLLAVTTQLAAAEGAEQIARAIVDEGTLALAADVGGVWLLDRNEQELVLQRHHGFSDDHAATFGRVPASGTGPLPDCVRSGRPLWIESRADYAARYPSFEPTHRRPGVPHLAFALLPIVIEGRAVGCICFAFHNEHRLNADDRTYLEVLASHAGQALRRTRLYEELRDVSEARQAMIQASPAATMLLDGEGVVQSWNAAAERIFGWTAAEVIGQFLPAVAEERRAELRQNVAHVLSGHNLEGLRTRRRRKDGRWFDVEVYASPVRFSDGRLFCKALVFDVSERVRMELGRHLATEASTVLSRSLDWRQSLLDLVQLPVAMALVEACFVEVVLDGRPAQTFAAGNSPVTDGRCRRLTSPLAIGHRSLGSVAWESATREFDALDAGILRDLADRIAAAVDNGLLYEEARSARQQAESASRAKDEFLAMLGHELRNPLAPITTALQLMRMQGPEKGERAREVIERQVKHLTHLVDDLLDVSRITRGKVELRRDDVSLSAIANKAIETVSPLFDQRRHTLDVQIPPALCVNADPTRLAQIVANLLSNAAKYTPPGGRVELRARRQDQHVILEVSDNGIGISDAMLPAVFDLFVQAPQASARTEGGLGLGLAIVRSLVEMHGGSVDVRSEGLGKGSTFTVVLPAGPTQPRAERPTPAAPLPAFGAQRRVLVVDDNQDAAILLAEALTALGHEVRTAFDGLAAIDAASAFDPEVVILDLGLPIMDGYEVAQRLRNDPKHADVRLIAVTGYGQDADKVRTRQAGFFAHFAKPVTLETLAQLILP